MAEEVELRELDFWSWVAKITEKLTFIRLNVLDHREITENDYELLWTLFRPYSHGEYPLYETKPKQIAENVSQPDLFTTECRAEVLKKLNGKVIELLKSEPKKTDKNDTKI